MIKAVADTVIKGTNGFIEINPQTASAVGVREGERATLTTPRGEAQVSVHLFEGIQPGVLAMVRGLGHTAYDGYLAGKGVNVNELIGPVEDRPPVLMQPGESGQSWLKPNPPDTRFR